MATKTIGRPKAAESTTHTSKCSLKTRPAQRPPAAQVARLRLTARELGLSPVFVGDAPLSAELFDARGRLVMVQQC